MDLQVLATHLRAAFPAAPTVTPLTDMGEGFGSLVIETANGIVFRIAKHAEARRGHQRERQVLPVIRRHVSGLRVPHMKYYLDTSAAFPFGVIGYEKLPGRPLFPGDIDEENGARIAGQVAEFLTALHGIDVGELRETGLPGFPPSRPRLAELWRNVSAYVAQHLSRSEHREIRRWWGDLLDYRQRHPYAPALVHGDCWYENMLFDDEQRCLVGIIDFENVAIGDAAIDLATQRYLGDQFAQLVIDAYYRHGVPRDLTGRVNDLMGLRELLGLELGIVTGNVDVDALAKVRDAILSAPR